MQVGGVSKRLGGADPGEAALWGNSTALEKLGVNTSVGTV